MQYVLQHRNVIILDCTLHSCNLNTAVVYLCATIYECLNLRYLRLVLHCKDIVDKEGIRCGQYLLQGG